MSRWGPDYDARWRDLEAAGHDVHGEAGFVESLHPATVLDAGCGTGRVAIELARRGIDVVGVDVDAGMLEQARTKAPDLTWVLADLSDVRLDRRFDVVVMAGNVMIFLTPGTEGAVVASLSQHLVPGGALVAGFQLRAGGLSLERYDELCAGAGLVLDERWSTWDREPWTPGADYAVSLHRSSGNAAP